MDIGLEELLERLAWWNLRLMELDFEISIVPDYIVKQ